MRGTPQVGKVLGRRREGKVCDDCHISWRRTRSEAEPAGAALDTATKYDVTFWPRSATDKIAFDAMLPFAKEQFPNLTVTFEIPAGSMLEKLKVALAADTPPDGFVMGLGSARYLVAQKAALSLQDYLKRDKQVETNLKSFAQATVQTYTFDNQLYAIPATNANEGRFVDDKGARWVLNAPQGQATIDWIVALQTRYGVHPEVDFYLDQNVLDRTIFQQGRLGMLIQGEFLSRYLYGNQKPAGGIPFNYDIAQLPFGAGKKKRASVYNGNGLAMVRGTKQPDGVWQWLHVCSFKEAQQQITNNWGSRGAHQGTYDTWLKDGGGGGPAGLNYQAIVKTADYAASYPVSPYLSQDDLVAPCTAILYEQVFMRKMTPADGLKQMEQQINANLQAAGAPA
jgi:ABC-type glycerol-3-phosphate transport system substrate-binding protein